MQIGIIHLHPTRSSLTQHVYYNVHAVQSNKSRAGEADGGAGPAGAGRQPCGGHRHRQRQVNSSTSESKRRHSAPPANLTPGTSSPFFVLPSLSICIALHACLVCLNNFSAKTKREMSPLNFISQSQRHSYMQILNCEFEISPVRLVQNTTGWQLHAERQSDRPKRYLLVMCATSYYKPGVFRPLYFESSHDYPAMGPKDGLELPLKKKKMDLSSFS
jgi:hypothetical protein